MTGRIPSFANLRLDASVVVTETPLNARQRQSSINNANANNANNDEFRHQDQLHGAVQVHRDGRPRNRHHRQPANNDEANVAQRVEQDIHVGGGAGGGGLGSLFRQNWLLPIHKDESQRLGVALSWVTHRFRHTDKLSKRLHRDLLGAVAVIIDCELYRLSTYTTYIDTPVDAMSLPNSHYHHHHNHGHHRKHEITAQNRISGLELIVASKVNARRLDHHAAGAENGMDGSVLDLVRRKYPGLEKNKQVEVSIEQIGRWADTATVLNWVRIGASEPQDPIALLFSKIDLVSILGSLPLPN